jgi:xanthine/CO dehydrogenase XdhC/CoxF family maturation factor
LPDSSVAGPEKNHVHLGIPALLDFYRIHSGEDSLVLVTIIGTEGSTYRKPGAMMLISRDDSFEGMISGGCLEGDLLHHAAEVFSSGQAKFVTYDMHAGDDLVWSLGLGCDGIIHLMLQRLDREHGFAFLEQLEASHAVRRAVLLALTTRSDGGLPLASFALLDQSGKSCGEPALLRMLQEISQPAWPEWRYRKICETENSEASETILVNIPPQTRVLVCGAGPDAVPVVRALTALDWDVYVVDHRPAYARADRFTDKCRVIQARPEQLAELVDLDEFDAAVVMSHHLENDSIYLTQLAKKDLTYLGCLGPRARRDRLRKMAGCPEQQVFGPVGLDIGAELPDAIALSLVAEIHAVLNHRSGLPLTPPDASDPA